MKSINLSALIRPHLIGIAPYSSARDDFKGQAQVYLDANENPFDNGLNRYPDPHQTEIKKILSTLKQVAVENIFLGNGSDEAIDLLMQAFCEPGKDEVIIVPPTYGMYKVSARINNIKIKEVLLDTEFNLDLPSLLAAITPQTKIIFLCSPNNPTGNSLDPAQIKKILNEFSGLVVIDEAYIDFSDKPSWVASLGEHQNLIVLQTLSKAWGLASIRLGLCLAHREIIHWMNLIKPPYNISGPSQIEAKRHLLLADKTTEAVEKIKQQRGYLRTELLKISCVKKIFPSDANFLLVKTTDANGLYSYLSDQGIIVRNRSKEPNCENCLRITIGTEEENKLLLDTLKKF
jgi:histidinol-phosphate aminotransferase